MRDDLKNKLPGAHFGSVNKKPASWKRPFIADPDDEELPRTPKSVRQLLGFDPLKEARKSK